MDNAQKAIMIGVGIFITLLLYIIVMDLRLSLRGSPHSFFVTM